MNTRYYDRINDFSIITAQNNALTKAEALGLTLNPDVFQDDLYPMNPHFREVNRFGDRYISIFGDYAPQYIYGLAHPFDKDNWYAATYLPISETILVDHFYTIGYGFEQTIGSVMLTVERQHEHSFSDIKLSEDSAEFYVGGELFVVVKKLVFDKESQSTIKEITSALKSVNTLYDNSELTTPAIHGRLSKVRGFEKFQGFAVSQQDGEYIHSTLSNFTKGFQFILSEFTENKVPLHIAEKVMWAFFGIDNEHVLRANEKAQCITGTLFVTDTYDSNTGRFRAIQNYHDIPSALHGFIRQRKAVDALDEAFHIDPEGLGAFLFMPVSKHLSVSMNVHRPESRSYTEDCLKEAKRLLAGNVVFSSRQDFFVETFVINNIEIKLYDIDGRLHTVDHLNNLIPIDALMFHAAKDDVWRVKANYENIPNKYQRPDPATLPTEWRLSRQKYAKPTQMLVKLGDLSINDIERVVKRLNIKAKASRDYVDMDTLKTIWDINQKYEVDKINLF